MGFDTLWLEISKPPEGIKFGCLEPRCKKSKNLNNGQGTNIDILLWNDVVLYCVCGCIYNL